MALPPFMNSTGLIPKIFGKIQEAKVPDRYTQDFQATVLGYGSGSALAFIPFLKRLGFLESDGKPADLYRKFRNADSSRAAMAEAMRRGFRDIFQRNEYAYSLSDEKLKNLIIELTGKEKGNSVVTAITGSFKACKQLADFEAKLVADVEDEVIPEITVPPPLERSRSLVRRQNEDARPRIGLSYTINLNLPETDNIDVFDAIFSSLRKNLLDDLGD